MKRILLTGMSGTGKSTALRHLRADDTLVIDLDVSEWVGTDPLTGERQFLIRPLIDYMRSYPDKHIVLAGCESNQRELYGELDAVILMTAPLSVMKDRILRRADNPYGKSSSEWARIVDDTATVEPLLARHCAYVCRTDRPLQEVVDDIRRFLV